MSHSWDEVQALLDDEFVDGDTKEHLLGAYIQENYFLNEDEIPDEVREYLDSYSMQGGDYDQGSVDEVYQRAQNESADRGSQHRQAEDDLDEARSELEGMQSPALTGSGVQTSDEIFDPARAALRVFETWLPINDQVPEDLRRRGTIAMDEIETRFDEQMGINFRKFLEDADRIRQAHTTLDEVNATTEQELNSVYQSWTGPAANASYDHYSQRLAPNVSALLEALSASPGVIEAAVENVYQTCRDKAEQVMELYTPTVGKAPPDIAERVMTIARYEEISQEEAKSVASWIDRECGTDLENGMNNDLWDQFVLPTLQATARQWIRNNFNPELHDGLLEPFEQICDDTRDAVDACYQELNTELGNYENEFSDASTLQQPPLGADLATGSGATSGSGGGDLATGSAGTGAMPGGGGSMPSLGGGSTPAGGGAPMPALQPAEFSPPSLPGPQGTEPFDIGQPAEPGNSLSPALTGPDGGQPETITIDDGDRKISVSSPDGQGAMTVTIDDGSGDPKTYRLDLGEATGSDGSAPVPREARPMPMPGEQIPGGTESIKAGPDGIAVIEDGEVTITAERPPGSPDQVMLTVDDGTGEPTTYLMDYADPLQPADPARTAQAAAAEQAPPVPPQAAHASGAGGASGLGGPAGGVGAPDPGQAPGVGQAPAPGQYVAAMSPGGSPGEAGLAMAADDAGRPSGAHAGGPGGMGGGMPMMGAMGGAGGAGDGDQERSASAWRTTGDLFDDDDYLPNAVRGALGEKW